MQSDLFFYFSKISLSQEIHDKQLQQSDVTSNENHRASEMTSCQADPMSWPHVGCVLTHVMHRLRVVEMFTSGFHVIFFYFSKINYKQSPNFSHFKTPLVITLDQLDDSQPYLGG